MGTPYPTPPHYREMLLFFLCTGLAIFRLGLLPVMLRKTRGASVWSGSGVVVSSRSSRFLGNG